MRYGWQATAPNMHCGHIPVHNFVQVLSITKTVCHLKSIWSVANKLEEINGAGHWCGICADVF